MQTRYNRKVFDFVIFSNVFIALCAVAMAGFTTHFLISVFPPLPFAGFLFSSTLASYSIHWYLTDEAFEKTAVRTHWLGKHKRVHAVFFLISVIGCGLFFIQLLHFTGWILPALFLTLMYTAPKLPLQPFVLLRKKIFAKTFLLALMWTYVTSVLPLLIMETAWKPAFSLFVFNRFTLIFPICILFDLRDRHDDKKAGVKSIVTLLSPEKIKIVFNLVIILNWISASFIFFERGKSGVDYFILLIPTILTSLFFKNVTQTKNDYLFYFILDGLMALSAILYFAKLFINIIFASG